MKKLEKWIGYRFDRADYNETGYDDKAVKSFARNLRAIIKKIEGVEELKIDSGYYYISGFIKGNDKFVYISLPDFRAQDEWVDDILIRTAESMKDFRGGSNRRTNLNSLSKDIEDMLS